MICPFLSKECQQENCALWRINDCGLQDAISIFQEIADQLGFDRQKTPNIARKEDTN